MDSGLLSEQPETMPPVLTVSGLNQAVGRMLERHFPLLWVSGEISNFTKAASGHWYFSLKDSSAQVRAVMFRGRAQYAGFVPREGDRVEVRALVTLYAARGEFQLSVEAMRRAGVGNLYEAFLQLKHQLQTEGLFDSEQKRALPRFPRVIGIVTSPQAAALRDVLTTLQRRAPHLHVILYPTAVQGDGSPQKIAAAIALASRRAECDLLLLCRGGGSIEDLWAFNEEVVARAIAACSMPVIAGIGHETDFTIADFVADLRAPTPTAAAELAARPRSDWQASIDTAARALTRALQRRFAEQTQTLDWLSRRLASPASHIRHERLKLDGLQAQLIRAARIHRQNGQQQLQHLRGRLAAQLPDARSARNALVELHRRLHNGLVARAKQDRSHLSALNQQLELLAPQRTLERGYALIVDGRGNIVRSPAELHPQQVVSVRLADGRATVGIASVQTVLGD